MLMFGTRRRPPTQLAMAEHARRGSSGIANSGPVSIWKVVDQSLWPVALIRNRSAFGRSSRWRIYYLNTETEGHLTYTTAEDAVAAVSEVAFSRVRTAVD